MPVAIPKGAVADIRRDEGLRLRPYRDTEGYLTVGYGTMIDTISEDEATLLLNHRLKIIWLELCAAKPTIEKYPVNIRRALCNMAYNLGVPRLLQFEKMWIALHAGELETAAAEALDSKWAQQVGDRATRVADMMRGAA